MDAFSGGFLRLRHGFGEFSAGRLAGFRGFYAFFIEFLRLRHVYYIEISGENRGKLANIDAIIEREWILPAKDGSLYQKIGDDWYYTFMKVQAIYRTMGGAYMP